MAKNVTQKLIESHLVEDGMRSGEEIGLKIYQTLTQNATGLWYSRPGNGVSHPVHME